MGDTIVEFFMVHWLDEICGGDPVFLKYLCMLSKVNKTIIKITNIGSIIFEKY